MVHRRAHRLLASLVGVTLVAGVTAVGPSFSAFAAPGDADVLVSGGAPTSVPRSSPFTFGTFLGNIGPATATNLVVTVTVPVGATYISATVSGGSCAEADGTVTCLRPELIPFDLSLPRVDVNVIAPDSIGVVTTSLSISADQPDPVPTNNLSTAAIQVGGADMSLDSPSSCCSSGPEMTLPFRVINVGPEPATDVEVTAALPAGVSLSTYTISGAGTCSAAASVVTCALGTLPNGATRPIQLVVTTADPPEFDFSVPIEITTSSFDYNPGNNARDIDVIVRTLISVGDASVHEGDGGVRTLKFPVTLRRAVLNQRVDVDYRVIAGTASGGPAGDIDDRFGNTRVLRFEPSGATGATVVTKFISVTVRPDQAVEGDEAFTVVLSNPLGGAGLGDPVGVGTILDDDPGGGPRVGIGAVTVGEGDDGTIRASVVVALAEPATTPVTFTVTAGGTAIADVDYKRLSRTGSKVFSISTGKTFRLITLVIYPNDLLQGDRTVTLTLSNPSGATVIGSGTGTITILDDD